MWGVCPDGLLRLRARKEAKAKIRPRTMALNLSELQDLQEAWVSEPMSGQR